jgi:SEC-C motif
MGDLIPFHLLFIEIAERETRNVTLFGKRGAPSKTYGLLEAYCPDPTCDCRRVMINVVDVDHLEDGYLAAISFGFDPGADMAGPFLDPLNSQSPLANMLLEQVSAVLSDRAYVDRLERHYNLVKATASPAHPAHAKLSAWLAEGDEVRPLRPRPRAGRNVPCPCGSGKKYKNCCLRKDMEAAQD